MSWIQQHGYYHFTPRWNLGRILRNGLLISKSQGKIKGVWLCTLSQTEHVANHVAEHQGCGREELVCLRVKPRLTKLLRRRKGVWISIESIPPCRLQIT